MQPLNLDSIAGTLESLEETIIFRLIDRAQFATNEAAYQPGASGFKGEHQRSLFELRLHGQECMDAEFGRFQVPEERPFSQSLPDAKRAVTLPDTGLAPIDFDVVNLCGTIQRSYLNLIPQICLPGDDGQYGSSVEHDVYALQAIARRVHYGALYVAESKFRDDPQGYRPLIQQADTVAMMSKLTRADVEARIIERIRGKAAQAQERVNLQLRRIVDPDNIVDFYNDTIIPLTKEGEIAYLLHRPTD